jgi:hypothetical protein
MIKTRIVGSGDGLHARGVIDMRHSRQRRATNFQARHEIDRFFLLPIHAQGIGHRSDQ